MEIECPPQALAVWLKGDFIQVRFPDRQLVEIPYNELGRLLNLMRTREHVANTSKDWRIGQPGCPDQYGIDDSLRERADRQFDETNRQRDERRKAEARKKVELKVKRRVELEEAERILAEAGL